MSSISIAIAGNGGTGALTVGNFPFEAANSIGWQGVLSYCAPKPKART